MLDVSISKPVYRVLADLTQESRIEVVLPLAVKNLLRLRIKQTRDVISGGFIDVFYNEPTGTAAYALILNGRRVFGADNAGGWHIHPFDDPERHNPLGGAISLSKYVDEIELHVTSAT